MEIEELENTIRDYIKTLYKATYNKRLEVKYESNVYSLILGIPDDVMPTTISLQTDDPQEFLKYIYEELKTRNYMKIYFYQVRRAGNLKKYEI
jgi:hypothetical protein